jgi:hypothetical protein
MYAQGLREEIIALQRRIKELEAQNHALASVLVQQLHQGSPILVPGEAISKVPAEGAGDEPLVAHTATSVSPHHTQNGTINSCPFHVHLIPLKPAFDTSHLTKPLAVILKQCIQFSILLEYCCYEHKVESNKTPFRSAYLDT